MLVSRAHAHCVTSRGCVTNQAGVVGSGRVTGDGWERGSVLGSGMDLLAVDEKKIGRISLVARLDALRC